MQEASMRNVNSVWILLIILVNLLPFLLQASNDAQLDKDVYQYRRKSILTDEANRRLGSHLTLTPEEKIVNDHLMKIKRHEMKRYQSGQEGFPPAALFTDVKEQIDKSEVFQFLQRMPKGGLLHVHDFALTNVDWLVSFVTYLPYCYLCYDNHHQQDFIREFIFSKTKPFPIQECDWKLVAEERLRYYNGTEAFDNILISSIILNSDKLTSARANQTLIWSYFKQYFTSVMGLLLYKPVFTEYVYRGLSELWKDNIQYFEIRVTLVPTYSLDGSRSSVHTVLKQYLHGISLFQKRICKICSVRLIVSTQRSMPTSIIWQKLKQTLLLRRMYPTVVAGFDLVGQEDTGKSLWSLVEVLKTTKVPFFFHAGETNGQGTAADENLVDALLLGAKRLGHGYAILKHASILDLIKKRNIPIEVCPISNQVLGLVSDLRNHPASVLIANNYSVVISSDDPAVWRATGLSHDFYAVFMAMVDVGGDLRLLKQLAINSIKFSSLPLYQRKEVLAEWEQKWREFIANEVRMLTRLQQDVAPSPQKTRFVGQHLSAKRDQRSSGSEL